MPWVGLHCACIDPSDRHVIWQWYSAFVAVTITFYIASTFLPYSSVTFYQFFWLWYAEFGVQYATVHIPPVVLTGTQSSVYSTLQFIFHQLFWLWYAEFGVQYATVHIPPVVLTMVRRVRCTLRYSSYSTSCSDWYEEFGVLHLTVHIPPVVLTGMQSSLYSTLQFIFHQLFWLVRRVRCTVRYSSYSTSCSDWYAEFGLQYATVHIPPVVLTMVRRVRCTVRYSSYSTSCSDYGAQSSVYSTLQFIFHQLFWLVRRVRCTAPYSSYSNNCFDWYAEFGVQYTTIHIPPVVLIGMQSSLYSTLQFIFHQLFLTGTQSSVYSTLQFIFHQLSWLVRRVRCTARDSSYSTSCSDWYAEFVVQYATVHIPPVVLTGPQSSVYSTLQFIFHQSFWLVRRIRCTVRYSSYSTSCSDWYEEFVVQYVTVHIPPVVLTATQSSLSSTLQFIFHQLFRLVRWVRGTVRYSSYSTSCSDWYAEFVVLHATVHIPPVVLTGTQSSLYSTLQFIFHQLFWLWYAEFVVQYATVHIPPVVLTGPQSSAYSTLQFIFHQLFWLVRRVRCTVRYSSYSTSCSNCYAEFVVLHATVHIPPVVQTGTLSSLYTTLQFIFHQLFWLVRRVRCTVRYSSYSTSYSDYGTQSSVYSTLQFIFHQLFWLVRRVRCAARYSSYSTSCSDWYAEFVLQYVTVHIPPVALTGTQSSLSCTLQFIFHQLSWLVRRVRCTVRYSSYSTSCSEWYAEFVLQYVTVHIPPVVLTGTQSPLYSTLQFIFHQLFWLARRVRCTVRYSSYSTSCSDWYSEFVVQYATVHIPPVVLTGTQSSLYSTLQFIFHQLFWLVRRVRCTALYSSYSTSCSDWYAEFVVLHVTVHIPPVVLTGMQSSVYSTLQFIFHQLFWLVRTVRCTVLYSSYSTRNMNCNVLYNELCVPVRTAGGIWTVAEEFLPLIYPPELEVKETTDTASSASFLDLYLEVDDSGQLSTTIYDKRDDFNFKIINFPNMCSNILASPAYGVYISQLIRYARGSSNYSDFLKRHLHLRNRLLDQGYTKIRLIRSLKKFIFRYQYLVEIYSVSAETIISDAFSYSENV